MTSFATQTNIDMGGPGLLGSDVSGASRRKSKLITIGAGLTLSGGVLVNTLDLSGYLTSSVATATYVPYTGATGTVNLGTNALTVGAITATAFSLPTTGNVVIGASGNERRIEFYNSAGNPSIAKYSNTGITVYKAAGGLGTVNGAEFICDSTGYVYWSGRGILTSSANGTIHVQNYDFNDSVNQSLAFGAATTSTNGARIKRVVGASLLAFRNGDDSADGSISCSAITASGTITTTSSGLLCEIDPVNWRFRLSTAGTSRMDLDQYSLRFVDSATILWSNAGNNVNTTKVLGLCKNDTTNYLQINNGTEGTLNGLECGAITASGTVTSTPTAIATSGMAFGIVENGTEKFGYRYGAGSSGELVVTALAPHSQSVIIRPRSSVSGASVILSGGIRFRDLNDAANADIVTGVITAAGATFTNNVVVTNGGIVLSANSLYFGTYAVHLRGATDVLEINNGTTGQYRDLLVRGITASGNISTSGSINGTSILCDGSTVFDTSGYRLDCGVAGGFNTITVPVLLQLGGTTSSYPAWKRSGITLAARLADDSADAPITCGAITASGAVNYSDGTIDARTSMNHALTLRATGAANAIRVLDSGGATKWSVDSTGSMTIGTLGYITFPHSTRLGDPNFVVTGGGTGIGLVTSGSFFLATGGTAATFIVGTTGSVTASGAITGSHFTATNTGAGYGYKLVGNCAMHSSAGVLTLRSYSGNDIVFVDDDKLRATAPIQDTPKQSTVDPTITDIPTGKRMGWYNSTSGEFRDWVNIGGTLKKSAAYT